jgi:Fe2+ transport system protein FeoA
MIDRAHDTPAPWTLDDLAAGAGALIEGFDGASEALPLIEAGLRPGVRVTLVRRAPLGCPLEVAVDGTRFALRRVSARGVRVIPDPA